MEKISIIIPVYNVENYLRECIDSVMNQTYKNLEIILIDDGSEDESSIICDEYAKKDSRIKVIHKQNGGQSDARNIGLDNVTGEYIGFVDSDDYIELDMYEHLYNNMKNASAQISCCNRFIKYKNKLEVYGTENFYEVMNSERAIELSCTMGYIGVSVYTKLYKNNIFKDITFPKGKKAEDVYIMYKLFDNAQKIVYDAKAKYYYRQRSGSTTRSNKTNIDIIEASKELMNFVEKRYPNILNVAIKNYVYSSIGVYDTIIKSGDKENNKIKEKIKKVIKKYYKIIIKDKNISKTRKIQLWLIRYCNTMYIYSFKIYNFAKCKIKKVE